MEKQFDAESKELIVLTETGAGAGEGKAVDGKRKHTCKRRPVSGRT